MVGDEEGREKEKGRRCRRPPRACVGMGAGPSVREASPHNFWNGRWLHASTLTPDTSYCSYCIVLLPCG